MNSKDTCFRDKHCFVFPGCGSLRALHVIVFLTALTIGALPVWAQSPGTPDSLDVSLFDQDALSYAGGVEVVALQPDGKIVLGGLFNTGVQCLARLNSDGTPDPDFNIIADTQVVGATVQTDGKIVIEGYFNQLRRLDNQLTLSFSRSIARLNTDAKVDAGFNPGPFSTVYSVAEQADGKILVAGEFTAIAGAKRNFIARLNPDGTLDAGFDPSANSTVLTVQVQTDGKILLGGYFTSLQPNGAAGPIPRNHIARLNADGTLDAGFDPNANNGVYCVTGQPDGKVLIGGIFTTLQPSGASGPISRNHLARVNADGTLDTTFDPNVNGDVHSLAVQTDGKILVGGNFTKLQPNGASSASIRNSIARVNADGTLDTAFDPNPGSDNAGDDNTIYSLAVQADGKVLMGGSFTKLQPNGATSPTKRGYFARLYNDPATQTLSVPDASQVLWQRGGASPEVSLVNFQQSVDGGVTWLPLGNGSRVGFSADWQLGGLALPANCTVRALGRTSDGAGGSGLVESVTSFSLAVPGPTLTGVSRSGGDLVFHGINGVSGGTLYLAASRDVTRPAGQWTPVATNVLTASGDFSFTLPKALTAGTTQQFYRLNLP
jgi:uncharacterized delta-60 repeat protein